MTSMFLVLVNLLNTTRCGKLLYSEINTYSIYLNNVKMLSTWGQSAWVFICMNTPAVITVKGFLKGILLDFFNFLISKIIQENSSETTRSDFPSRTTGKNSKNFYEWLVGVTDGDGTFHFSKSPKGVWSFTFKIGQSNYNLRLLYYIKSMLGVGSVSVPNSKDNCAEYRVRNIKHIIQYILPIFDQYLLLTSKHFNYTIFKQAILIMNDSTLTKEQKDIFISKLKSHTMPNDYVSPAWQTIDNMVTTIDSAMKVLSKSWLIGFTEVSANFILIKKNTGHIVHTFEIVHTFTQRDNNKFDFIIFIAIAKLLNIENIKLSLHYLPSAKICVIKTQITDPKSISNIILFYHRTMKGLKSLEYRIWARSFNKGHTKQEKSRLDYLEKVYKINSKINLKLEKSSLGLAEAKWSCRKEVILSSSLSLSSWLRTINKQKFNARVFSTKAVNLSQSNLSLIPWGINLESGVSLGRLSNQIRNMYELHYFQSSVLVGVLLSDGWSVFSSSTRRSRQF